MRPGDVVTRVGDSAVSNTGELLAAVAALPPDSKARLSVQRGAQALRLEVQVADRAQNLRRSASR